MAINQRKICFDLAFVGIVLLIVLSIFNNSYFGATLSWVIIPCLLILFGIFSGIRIFDKKTIWLFALWFIYFLSTALIGVAGFKRDIFTFLFFCFVYAISVSMNWSSRKVRIIKYVYILISLLVSLLVIYNWFSGVYEYAWIKRATLVVQGVFKDSNYVSCFIVPGCYLAFANAFNETKSKLKILNILVSIVIAVACLALSSRGGILALSVSIVFFLVFHFKRSFKQLIVLLIVGVLSFVLLSSFIKLLPSAALDRLSFANDFQNNERIELWMTCLEQFKKHFLIGGGMESTQVYCGRASHNNYLNILCDSGIVGFCIFVVFLGKNVLICSKNDLGLHIGSVVAFMLPLFFINGFNTATFYVPLILLTIFSSQSLKEEKKNARLCNYI